MLDEDKFGSESILVHEFGHCVMNCGFSPDQHCSVTRAYKNALQQGAHGDASTYMMSNVQEYWAEMTQAWFHASARSDVNNGIRTRADVQRRDPQAAALLRQVYGDARWRYTTDCPNIAKWDLASKGLSLD